MKKILILLIALPIILTSCSKNEGKESLESLSDHYSLDGAKSDNCVVHENGDITYGQSEWDNFITKTDKGKKATVRLAYYYTLDDPSHYSEELYEEIKDDYPALYLKDLSFDGDKYTVESIDNGQLISKDYKYLMKYVGAPRSTSAIFSEYTYYVLVNDNTVTWDAIEHGLLSSQSGASIEHDMVYSDLKMKEK